MRLLLLLALLIAPTLSHASAPSPSVPSAPTSRAAFACGLMGDMALEMEVGMPAFRLIVSVWENSLIQLRKQRVVAVDSIAPAPGEMTGTAKLCLGDRACQPARARVEIDRSGLIAGTVLTGRIFWYEASLDKEISLPLSATIAPRRGSCR